MRKRGGAGLPFRPLRRTEMPAAGPEGRRRGAGGAREGEEAAAFCHAGQA